MNASSQTTPGPLPSESPHDPQPLSAPANPAGVFAAYGAAVPAAATQRAKVMANPDVSADRQAPGETPDQSLDVKAITDRAYQLGVDDTRAELARMGQDGSIIAWYHARRQALALLCAGRPDNHLLTVREVLTAADGHTATTAPLAIAWDGLVMGPSGDTDGENTLVPCTTARGGSAALVLDDEQRLKLGELLLATLHPAETCATPGCGMTADELDTSNPFVQGWIRVDVVGTEGPARWWCSVWCANSAITAAGAELAAADPDAAVDPDAQAPMYEVRFDGSEPHPFDPERLSESDAKQRAARCRHCQGARTDALHIWANDDRAALDGGL